MKKDPNYDLDIKISGQAQSISVYQQVLKIRRCQGQTEKLERDTER